MEQSLGKATQQTVLEAMLLSGTYIETIQFFLLFPSPYLLLILGYSRLRLHDPHIDQETGTIRAWRAFFCCWACLAAPPTWSLHAPAIASPDLLVDPKEYHDIQEIVSKTMATSVPPHWPYNCATDLLQGTSVFSLHLRNQQWRHTLTSP